MIFDERIKEKQVSYVPASSLLNNDGVCYGEYGCHDDRYQIDAIFYDGCRNSQVFAYLGFPKESEKQKVPAMVLLHGGVGKAEIDWVKKWNDLGIAAIAIDLYGDGPEDDPDNPYNTGKKKHPYAGLCPWGCSFEEEFSPDYENARMYQNVFNVVSATNLLIQSGKVDPKNIGLTGISWGGITTLITAGFDDRLKFAIPVYGCGFLDECRTYFHAAYEQGGDPLWDPAKHAALSSIPILLINGDADGHFSLNATSHTHEVLQKGYLSIHHGLVHGQYPGDSLPQIYHFARHFFFGTHDPIHITGCEVSKEKRTIRIHFENGNISPQPHAALYYLTTAEIGYGGGENLTWYRSDAFRPTGSGLEMDLPSAATWVYVSLEDHEGSIFSTRLLSLA